MSSMGSPPDHVRATYVPGSGTAGFNLDQARLPIDLAGVAFVYRPDEGQDLPDLIVWKHVVDSWHRLLTDLTFDELAQRCVVAAEFPRVVDQGGRHASTATAAVTTLTPDLEIECLSGGDHVVLAGVRIQLLDRGGFSGRR